MRFIQNAIRLELTGGAYSYAGNVESLSVLYIGSRRLVCLCSLQSFVCCAVVSVNILLVIAEVSCTMSNLPLNPLYKMFWGTWYADVSAENLWMPMKYEQTRHSQCCFIYPPKLKCLTYWQPCIHIDHIIIWQGTKWVKTACMEWYRTTVQDWCKTTCAEWYKTTVQGWCKTPSVERVAPSNRRQ